MSEEIVTGLFTVFYEPLPACNLGHTYFEFRKSCAFSLAAACEVFKKYYWNLLSKSKSDFDRFFTPGGLYAYRVDVDFFKGSKPLNYCGTLYLSEDSSDPFHLKDFLCHPDDIYYQQLSLFDEPYWSYK